MLDRVRLKADGSVQVDMLQMLSGDSAAFWHNRDVMRLVYDHLKHPHELYVGTNHGITRFTPDKFKPIPVRNGYQGIEMFPSMTYDWMSDHLHPQPALAAPARARRDSSWATGAASRSIPTGISWWAAAGRRAKSSG